LGLYHCGAALGRLVVVARLTHLVFDATLGAPGGALGAREAQFPHKGLRTAIGLHR
jgi:hypothetical protein